MTFSDWWTNDNNPKLEKSDYLYGIRHLIVLAIVVCACVILTIIFRKKSEKVKDILFKTFGWIFLFFEIFSRIVNFAIEDNFSFERVLKIILPMHICSVMVFVFIVAIFTRKDYLLQFSVISGLLATVAFLLYPAVGLNQKYMAFTCIYSTFTHMLGFVTVVLLMTLSRVKFEFKQIWKPFVCFVVMFLWGAILNFIIFPGSDYMYMVNDPLELGLKFPYQILYIVIISVYIIIFYVIDFAKEKIKQKRKNLNK